MALLLSGVRIVVGGITSSDTFAIPQGLKNPGKEQTVLALLDATAFPLADVTLTIGLSTDGGASFRTASGKAPAGVSPGSGKWAIGYALGPDDVPTHAILNIDSPLGFSASVSLSTIEAI